MAGQTILVGAGLGAAKAACDQGVALANIDTIFITHLHSDHYLELGPLIHTAWVSDRSKPLTVYGPSRLINYWNAFLLVDGVDAIMRRQTNGDDRLKHHILRSHTSAEDVGRIAAEANVNRLVLNHFVPDGFPEFTDESWENAVRKTWTGPLVLAKDGSRLVID